MISSQLSQQARQDFAVVLKMAQSIGLGDCPPRSNTKDVFISNTHVKKHRQRRCNYSDLTHVERDQKGKRIRQKSFSLRTALSPEPSKTRKGSCQNVFVNTMKPYENPKTFIMTQKKILQNDMLRLRRYSKVDQRCRLMSRDKQTRSKILGQLSEEIIAVSSPAKKYSTPQKYFGQSKRSKILTPHTVSQQKLALSFDFSKFNIVQRQGFVGLLSKESSRSRQVQTAGQGKRTVRLRFNTNNKAELLYPRPQSQSQLQF